MKNITRRQALAAGLALGGTAYGLLPATAQDADFLKQKTVSFICAFPPGSGADIVVRYFADQFQKLTGATTIVENKPGAGGNIAGQYVVRAAPDGHTIFFHTGSSLAGNMHMFKQPPFDAAKDLQVVSTINKQPFMIFVAPDSPFKTLADLTAYLKEQGSKASYGVNNTSGKVLAAIYKQMAGFDAVEVSYKTTADTSNDLRGGQLAFSAQDPISALGDYRQNRIRLLAISSAEHLPAAMEIPTMTESGFPMDQVGWFATMVPAATPRPIVDKLNALFNQLLKQDNVKKFVEEQGGAVYISTPDEGQAFLKKEIVAWADLVKVAKIPKQ